MGVRLEREREREGEREGEREREGEGEREKEREEGRETEGEGETEQHTSPVAQQVAGIEYFLRMPARSCTTITCPSASQHFLEGRSASQQLIEGRLLLPANDSRDVCYYRSVMEEAVTATGP